MRISIRILINDDDFRQQYREREINIDVPDDSTDIFSQIKFGDMVEEHLSNAVEEYALMNSVVRVGPQEVPQSQTLDVSQ